MSRRKRKQPEWLPPMRPQSGPAHVIVTETLAPTDMRVFEPTDFIPPDRVVIVASKRRGRR